MTRRTDRTNVLGLGLTPLEKPVSKDLFKSEIQTWANRMGAQLKEIHIRPMTKKWGSCSTNGRVSFNAEVLARPAEFRKRVIVEELVHLKVPNHGRLFKALLKAYLNS